MTPGGGDEVPRPAGGPARHVPVLLDEVIEALALKEGGTYVDGTFGAGGYSRAILSVPGTRLVALDRDPSAIAGGADLVREMQGRLDLVQTRFSLMHAALADLAISSVDGVTLDIGVSSMQLDEAIRGFSFRADGPLDMRMESAGRSAADIVNEDSVERIADILFHYGEERFARKIARAIVHDELGELVRAMISAEQVLKPGGRLVIVSFHSLEDRIVKQFFSARSGRGQARSRLLPGEPVPPPATFDLVGRQPVAAGEAELARNPRARSAKLRAAERTDAPARRADASILSLAALPDTERKGR